MSASEARRNLDLARAQLDAFDRRWAGSWFKSKARERAELVGKVEDARIAHMLAVHDDERAAEAGLASPASRLVPEGKPSLEVSRADIEAERARRIRDGEPYGVGKLAAHFDCSESTIRRRLGLIQ